MQKEPRPGTPKLNNSGRRPRNPTTPENRIRNVVAADVTMSTINRPNNLRHRMTMAPSDIMIPPGLVTKRRIGNAARLNSTLSQFPAQVPVKSEPEYPENEISLLYDKFLQAKAAKSVVERKLAEKERSISVQTVAVFRERGIAKKNAEKAKLRKDEINNAYTMQMRIDEEKGKLVTCFDDLKKSKVKEKLLELKKLLEPLDELHCKGIEIPDDSEGCSELFESLNRVGEVLKSIKESSEEKGNMYRELEIGLKSLRGKHVEIECVKKKFDEVLCGLQVLVLKDASHSLSPCYPDDFCDNLQM